jgi:hypothetical protein
VLKHKDLEVQLANAKLQQSELKIVELTERSKKEKTIVCIKKVFVRLFFFVLIPNLFSMIVIY